MPFIALAIGLSQSGHDVTVAYTSIDNKDYSSFEAAHDISLIKAYERFDEHPTKIIAKIVKSRNPYKDFAMYMEHYFDPAINEMYGVAKKLCKENALVIGHSIHYPLAIAALKVNCPRVAVALCPMVVETKYTSPFDINFGTWLNSRLWKFNDRIARKKIYRVADAFRKKKGLSPFNYLQDDLYLTKKLTLIAAAPELCPRRPDWSSNIQISGFFNPPIPNEDWQMPVGLSDFLSTGEPPVYFTFGSYTSFDIKASIRLFLEAAKKAGVRAIIQSDWQSLSDLKETPNIYKVQSIPHEYVFPYCAMIVHHGGAGTTHTSLKAGRPSLVVAHGLDQHYWGRKLSQIGVAGKVLHRRTVNSDNLAKGLQWILNKPQMLQNAQKTRQTMLKENGVDKAVALINKIFQS